MSQKIYIVEITKQHRNSACGLLFLFVKPVDLNGFAFGLLILYCILDETNVKPGTSLQKQW